MFFRPLVALLCGAAATLASAESVKIEWIDFYAYTSADDLSALRRALPFREGEELTQQIAKTRAPQAKRTLTAITGRPTELSFVCCAPTGGMMLFIGLGDQPITVAYRAAPTGTIRVPREILAFDADLNKAFFSAAQSGGAEETDLKQKLAAYRPLAAQHASLLLQAAAESGDANHRAVAAFAVGHALDPTAERARVLVDAARDPDATVRNNAIRGLIDWVAKLPAGVISPQPFLAMVASPIWTDRNKGSLVLWKLAESKDPQVLDAIRNSNAIPDLKEMAAWRSEGHAYPARKILEFIAQ